MYVLAAHGQQFAFSRYFYLNILKPVIGKARRIFLFALAFEDVSVAGSGASQIASVDKPVGGKPFAVFQSDARPAPAADADTRPTRDVSADIRDFHAVSLIRQRRGLENTRHPNRLHPFRL